MAVPYTFGTATAAIPLSQLDSNFATAITIGNTAVQLGNTVTTLNNMTLANVTISSGTVAITNVAVTTANVSGTANVSTLVVVGNATVGGNTTITGNITAANANVTSNLVLFGGTANGVAYLNTSKQVTTGSALTYNGTDLAISGKITSTVANNAAYQIAGAFTNATNADFLVQLKTSYTQIGPSTATPLSFAIGGTQAMTLDASGNLLLAKTNSPVKAGSTTTQTLSVANTIVTSQGTSGVSGSGGITKSNGGFCAATTGTLSLDLLYANDSGSTGGFAGILVVSNVRYDYFPQGTTTVFSVSGRGTTATFTSLNSTDNSGGGASFTLSMSSNSVITVTNTFSVSTFTTMTFTGAVSLGQ
jgi:hypothetical protein